MLQSFAVLELFVEPSALGLARLTNRRTVEGGPKQAWYVSVYLVLFVTRSLPPRCSARILRLLSTNHIFREVAPDVFAHNRLSSVLDTGKSVAEIVKEYVLSNIHPCLLLTSVPCSPESKHDGSSGLPALFEQL